MTFFDLTVARPGQVFSRAMADSEDRAALTGRFPSTAFKAASCQWIDDDGAKRVVNHDPQSPAPEKLAMKSGRPHPARTWLLTADPMRSYSRLTVGRRFEPIETGEHGGVKKYLKF